MQGSPSRISLSLACLAADHQSVCIGHTSSDWIVLPAGAPASWATVAPLFLRCQSGVRICCRQPPFLIAFCCSCENGSSNAPFSLSIEPAEACWLRRRVIRATPLATTSERPRLRRQRSAPAVPDHSRFVYRCARVQHWQSSPSLA